MVAGQVTQLLADLKRGDPRSAERLLPLIYDELRELAGRYMHHERRGHTLQPTALVHEAYLRLVADDGIDWAGRAHFLGVAARAMRQILVNHAIARKALKRGGDRRRVALDEALDLCEQRSGDLVELDRALQRLADIDAQQSRIVELRFFGGFTIEETAQVLGISPRTVSREWTMARAWLRHQLGAGGNGERDRPA